MAINKINSRELLDSRGNPALEAEIQTDKGIFRAIVPSGASTGIHEAIELRDNDDSRFHGKGLKKAIKNIKEKIAPALIGKNPSKQEELDKLMCQLDGTKNKSNLGANSILALSMAIARAGAAEKNLPLYKYLNEIWGESEISLPMPSLNVINGGKHAGNKLQIQEYMIMPIGAETFSESIRMVSEVYHELKSIIHKRYGIDSVNVGDEGGFAPPLNNPNEPLELLDEAIEKAGYTGRIKKAIDAAASEFYSKEGYTLKDKPISSEELSLFYETLSEKGVISLEDPFEQDDINPWIELTAKLPLQIVGDDLLVTNPERIKEMIEKKACNALLLKLNQIGTVTESLEAARLSREAGWKIMVSHRSGETEDTFIADFAVAISADQIKSGAPARGERTSKYNQLLRIEEESKAKLKK